MPPRLSLHSVIAACGSLILAKLTQRRHSTPSGVISLPAQLITHFSVQCLRGHIGLGYVQLVIEGNQFDYRILHQRVAWSPLK